MPDFKKTETYGFFKPSHDAQNWHRLLDLNWEMADSLFFRFEARLDAMKGAERLNTKIETLEVRIKALERLIREMAKPPEPYVYPVHPMPPSDDTEPPLIRTFPGPGSDNDGSDNDLTTPF